MDLFFQRPPQKWTDWPLGWTSADVCLDMSVVRRGESVIREEGERPGRSQVQGCGEKRSRSRESVRCCRLPVLAKLCKNNCVSKWNGHFSVDAGCSFGNVLFKSFYSPNLNSFLMFRKHF